MSALALLPYLVVVVALWFLLIRPQQRRARAAREAQLAVGPGTKILLTAGIFGTVTDVDEDGIHVEIAEGVTVRVMRAAIGHVIPADDELDDQPEDDQPDEDDTPEIETGTDAAPKEN